MFRIEETTVAEVYAHALDEGGQPVIAGTEVSYDDPHDLVTYHADRYEEAEKACIAASKAHDQAALNLAILADLADEQGRDPRSWATYDVDLGRYRETRAAWHAASKRATAAFEAKKAYHAKIEQDAAFATYGVTA
jgi:hypothetical protein